MFPFDPPENIRKRFVNFLCVFNCCLAVSQPTLGHYRADIITQPVLITVFLQFWLEGCKEPRNEFGYLCPAERLVVFEPGKLQF